MTLTLQLFKNSNDAREKLRLNFHSLSVSELLEYGHKVCKGQPLLGRCENPEWRNITEYHGISRNITEYGGISQNMAEYHGIWRNIMTFSQKIPEHHDIFRW